MQRPMPMHESPRCGARTRSGEPCRSPAVRGKLRCRMHGARAGVPKGNRNPLDHGHYTAEAVAERREVRDLIRRAREVMDAAG